MIAIRLVRSKLRKREDHSNAVHPEPAVVQTATPGNNVVSTTSVTTTTGPAEGCCTQTTVVTTTTTAVVTMDNHNNTEEPDPIFTTTTTATAEQFIWQFPPPYPPPNTPPPQYTLYNDQVGATHSHYLSSNYSCPHSFAHSFFFDLKRPFHSLLTTTHSLVSTTLCYDQSGRRSGKHFKSGIFVGHGKAEILEQCKSQGISVRSNCQE